MRLHFSKVSNYNEIQPLNSLNNCSVSEPVAGRSISQVGGYGKFDWEKFTKHMKIWPSLSNRKHDKVIKTLIFDVLFLHSNSDKESKWEFSGKRIRYGVFFKGKKIPKCKSGKNVAETKWNSSHLNKYTDLLL